MLRIIFALLCFASPVFAGETRGVITRGGIIAFPSAVISDLAPDLCNDPATTTCWRFEETGTAIRVNSALPTSCGGTAANCDLTPSQSIPQSTTHIEGSYSNSWGVTQVWQTCSACTALRYTTAFTAGCALNSVYLVNLFHSVLGQSAQAGLYDNGWYLVINTGHPECYAGYTLAGGNTSTQFINTWYEFACNYDGTTLRPVINQTLDSGAPVTLLTSTQDFYVGGQYIGLMDMCWVVGKSLPATEHCRIASCGFRNQYDCRCKGATWLSTGRNVQMGSCTLPSNCAGSL